MFKLQTKKEEGGFLAKNKKLILKILLDQGKLEREREIEFLNMIKNS